MTTGNEQSDKLRRTKRIGLAILGIATALMSIPMVYGGFSGLSKGRVWDPYTGQLLSDQASDNANCLERARILLNQAGAMEGITSRWEEPMRQWTAKCPPEKFPEAYRMLVDTRRELAAKRAGVSGTDQPE